MALRWIIGGIGVLLLCSCAGVQTTADPAAQAEQESTYLTEAIQHQGVIIAGQPAPKDLQALSAAGVQRVFNLRTEEEMAKLDFDQAAQLASLAIDYQRHPVDDDAHPYGPAVLDAFSAAMAASDGPLLLHCGSGARAAQVYAAWLVRERGYRLDDALRTMSPKSGWPLPLEKLLDRPLRLEFADQEPR
jgi:uncharacterized protein (TIGR01244 family)